LVEESGTNYSGGGGTYPNMFDAHPPFQIDGNFGVAAGIAEMLLQRTVETVHVLPALPGSWKKGFCRGLKARGRLTVDISWDGDKTSVTLYSPCDRKIRFCCRGGKARTLELKAGEGMTVSCTDQQC
jgi:alpha-L-fucosidase 2